MNVSEYLRNVNALYKSGRATEHSYRGDLTQLLQTLVPSVNVTNEPQRIECGAPDYIITNKDIPIGYIEAKDIGISLDATEKSEQLKRYLNSLNNLILTDYVEFRLFRNGEKVKSISLGHFVNGNIKADQGEFDEFTDLIKDFCSYVSQTITSAEKLAKMMAGKARMLESVFENALKADVEDMLNEDTALQQQYQAFKDVLLHDISPKEFSDLYAQTIAYGMFAARLHDPTLDDFSRYEAAQLIPTSNPLLRKLFQYIAGYDLDDRIAWIVDALADIFLHTDVNAILKSFGRSTGMVDPMIHFYETFLAEYDPKLRKSRGVWYTPEPVVNFIVRAVDDILKTEFDLSQGLADRTKTTIKVNTQIADNRSKTGYKQVEKEVHKVQILDPATGTGTFLAEVVKQVYKRFEGQQGIWSNYVENHLIPRLNGFEILMASYAMAHLKLDMLLSETGFISKKEQRLRIYLTNSLEEHHPDTGTLFAGWLSSEANEANHIKRDTPVMVVLGNPPYSGHSSNKGEWIENLIKDYKQEPSGGKLKEQNSKWLNDDYVKFIRYSQMFVDKNKEGILAFITNNGYLDNPTFRGMRYHLLQSFNKIILVDLHGSNKKKETTLDGSPDQNVFDIQQGVSIILAIKTESAPKKCLVKSYNLLGSRQFKYKFLSEKAIDEVEFQEFFPSKPDYLFKYRDESLLKEYNLGFHSLYIYQKNVMGFQTHRDNFAIGWNHTEIKNRAISLIDQLKTNDDIYDQYLIKDNRDWKLEQAREEIQKDKDWESKITSCTYRPFDSRSCYFSYVMMDYPRTELINHCLRKDNLIFGVGRQGIAVGDIDWCLTLVAKSPVDANVFRRGGINLCPLYLYGEDQKQQSIFVSENRVPNLKIEFVSEISDRLGLNFTSEKESSKDCYAPIDILDYIYAILHSPTYREKYKEFLKIDFPRVPYPEKETFWQLVELGGQLRQIHLLESPVVDLPITSYPVGGDNFVNRPIGKNDWEIIDKVKLLGRVWINDQQYFDQVPEIAWNFYIGGYQPAQKWLKDRKGRELSIDDIMHYQKIIVALNETHRLMGEIDEVIDL